MQIAQKYSHLNGEEYLLVHKPDLYNEIQDAIGDIDASLFLTKVSKEATRMGQNLYNPAELNEAFKSQFVNLGWAESRYSYYITLDRELMEQSIPMTPSQQRAFLISKGDPSPIHSYNQTDFVKDAIAVEVQFGKYSFVAYDLFVKHMMFYTGNKINLGIEILPTKAMQNQMSSGPVILKVKFIM